MLKLNRCFGIHFVASRLAVGVETRAQGLRQELLSIVSGPYGNGQAVSDNGDTRGEFAALSISPTPTTEPADGERKPKPAGLCPQLSLFCSECLRAIFPKKASFQGPGAMILS